LRLAPRAAPGSHEGDDPAGVRPPLPGNRGGTLRSGIARLDSLVPQTRIAQPNSRPLSGGGQHAPRTGATDGRLVRAFGGSSTDRGPRFDQPVPHGGYAWWYIDALSDDKEYGLTLIAFVGSVFSPYYARARQSGGGDPLNHCALNVALYSKRGKRWALTERRRNAVHREADSLVIGPSAVSWQNDALTIHIDERTFPLPGRIEGVVRLYPSALPSHTVPLDADGRHRWSPLAPSARVEVAMRNPALHWSGAGYFDTNAGDEALEKAFARWHWSRASVPGGTMILYDVARRSGEDFTLALHCDSAGQISPMPLPPAASLPRSGWRIARATRCDAGQSASVLTTLEDTPFYVRSLISTQLNGQRICAMHESLSLDRFRAGWVRQLLPFRMPRTWR
jgi:carotenoid 1,2-hydratase